MSNSINIRDKKRLQKARKSVVRSFGRGNPRSWRNKDFEDLSFEIKLASKILISAATLKRIFGKNKTEADYYPQASTLEALEVFGGLKTKGKTQASSFPILKIAIFAIPLFFASVFLFIIYGTPEPELHAKLKLSKIEGASPATVFFEYQIPTSKDSIFISFDDENPREYLDPNRQHISHYYRFPGLFRAKIQTKKKTISEHAPVFIPTKGWQALANYFEEGISERYFPIPMEMVTQGDYFHPTRKSLSSAGIDTSQIAVVRLDNYKKTEINGDTFFFRTRLKNINYWPIIRCYAAFIFIVGENNSIMFKFSNEGCSQFNEYRLSEKYIHGNYHDLSDFSIDMKEWHEIEIENIDKETSINIDDKKIFSESYLKSLGNILGVSLVFHGSGYVDYVEMYDSNEQKIFDKDF